MKKIRLFESELVSLIKKVINETEEDMVKDKKFISSLTQELGTKTYLDIIRGNKSELFSRILKDKHIIISTPDDSWYEDNINKLKIFDKIFGSSNKQISWKDGDYSTLKERVTKLIGRCENKDYVGFIDVNEDKKVWSLLNKIDTNYSNWESMINERLTGPEKDKIDGSNRTEVVEKYFKQRPLEEVLSSDRLLKFREYEKTLDKKIDSLSFADIDLLDAFSKKNSNKLEEIFRRIRHTSDIGDKLEFEFLTFLRNSEKPNLKIIDFSSPGSVVDTAFGVDCIIFLDGKWFAVQVKGGESGIDKAKYAFIHTLGINSISIYEKNNQFYYYTPSDKTELKSFEKDFGV